MLICRWGKHSEISPASRAVYYSKSVGPWTRVKIDDKTKGKKPIQFYAINQQSVGSLHENFRCQIPSK